MRVRRRIAVFLIFFFWVTFWISGGEKGVLEEKISSKAKRSLVRKELLLVKRKELKPPRRNIFSPRIIGIEDAKLEIEGEQSPQNFNENQAVASDEASARSFDLRYIGYIDSGDKIVALIIFEGEALAVEEGEKISEEFTIGKITTKEIEIIGLGAEKRKYSLEGEK